MIDRRPFLKNSNPGLNIIAEIIWKLIPKIFQLSIVQLINNFESL